MSWIDKILSDYTLSRGARRLAAVIGEQYAATNARYCSFYDNEAAGQFDTGSAVIRGYRLELMRRGYLLELQAGTGRPNYALRLGHRIEMDADNVA
jgi:hypothetical protein